MSGTERTRPAKCGIVVTNDVVTIEVLCLGGSERRNEQNNPTPNPLHTSLLSDVTALMVPQARDAMDRTGDLTPEALAHVPS